ncbi:dipeptidase (plasmid) [Actinacidiphila glaucinigra]|uniref:M15 family metallopeptidase n=1 Tax=Actinacidiphila glaucinigra TaxID=235986 RepID=UPI002DDB79CA|nr:M15 family metallopeptidase [Actinacidiphila glaucinigra]WSD65812.1 dipeptidase [Actinacidiphila glaucinigra]
MTTNEIRGNTRPSGLVIQSGDVPETAGDVVTMSDPRVAAVRVADCGEPLVSLRDDDRFLIDERKANVNQAFAMIRSGLVDRLWMAEEYLRERGHRLRVFECYRPQAQQNQYFQEEMSRLATEHSDLTTARLVDLAGRYVAPAWIAPHSCGGAVDVTLAALDGTELNVDCRINTTPREPSDMSFLDTQGVLEHARSSRTLLLSAMTHGGWVPHRYKSWHFEIGTRFAALMTGLDEAVYGVIPDPHADVL